LYKLVRPYRQWYEVQSYRKELATVCYSTFEFAVIALVERYDLRLSVDEAKALLLDWPIPLNSTRHRAGFFLPGV